MGYYMGDAGIIRSRGGAMRGDPGFFSFLKGAASTFAGFIPGVGSGISSAISRIGGGSRAVSMAKDIGGAALGVVKRHPVLTGAGAAAVGGVGAEMHHLLGHRKCKHINPRTGKCVRRMRVTNTKALRRALRRAHGFARVAMKTIHLVHPRKKGRFGGFKHRRKK